MKHYPGEDYLSIRVKNLQEGLFMTTMANNPLKRAVSAPGQIGHIFGYH